MSKDKDYDEYCLKAGIENRNCSTDTTHYEGCYDSGPRHYECALREVKMLRREWVGLTDDEKHDCYLKIDIWSRCVEAVEAKLKEKNGG
jgi:hypothetical protein